MALGTWDYSKLQCYDTAGNQIPCSTAPVHYHPNGYDDMKMKTYDGTNQGLNPSAFNVPSFMVLDPSANTQTIWYHYNDIDNPEVITSGKFSYTTPSAYTSQSFYDLNGRYTSPDEKLGNNPKVQGMNIYATSAIPGSVNVRWTKESGIFPHAYDGSGNPRTYAYKLRLPKIIYKNGYPFCIGCIFRETDFFNYLRAHKDFNDGNGNWYGFYMLAETEYTIPSHYLEPYEYAAVLNEYVEKITAEFPNARFILESPVAGNPELYKPYLTSLYNQNLLTQTTKDAIKYNSLDAFVRPPPGPDIKTIITDPDTKKDTIYDAVTDIQLQENANEFVASVSATAQFLYQLNGKLSLIPQTGVYNYKAATPSAGSLTFGSATCSWCKKDNDVWYTTEYGTARTLQLAYSKLAQQANTIHVAAWAYWGNVQQINFKEPVVGAEWGYLNHGIYWLSWPAICTTQAGCPYTTNAVWPSRPGMVYLKLANGCPNYRPVDAPGWWPAGSLCDAIKAGDANGDGKVDGLDYIVWLNHFGQTASGPSNGNFNGDAKVDGLDYIIWLNNFGK